MPAPTRSDQIDRVNADDEVVGTVARGDALAEHAGFRVVHVLVLNTQGDILLQQVGRNRTRSPERWGSSVAGYLHAGEAPLHGASRRMQEEIGVTTPLQFCGRARMDDEGSTKFIYVYLTHSDTAWIVEPAHIQHLRFWSPHEVQAALEEEPDVFTKTLPYVLDVAEPSLEL